MNESYCTTRQFAKRDRDYVKHCGPTAITNLVLALSGDPALEPAQVFDQVAAIGQRLGVYWNMRATKHFGVAARVRFGGPATAARVRQALAEGSIVYLEMHLHPKYHNHHLLIYGADRQGLRVADGWQQEPVYLSDRDLRRCMFFSIINS